MVCKPNKKVVNKVLAYFRPDLDFTLITNRDCIYVREIRIFMHLYNSNGEWSRIVIIFQLASQNHFAE